MSDVYESIASAGVLPVIVAAQADDAGPLADALVTGGIRCAEVTLRTEAAEEAISVMARNPSMLVGAGTVLGADQAKRAVAAGAQFIVSPGLDLDLARRCSRLDIPIIPGVATATEIQAALRHGLRVVKLFPSALLGGPRMVSAMSAPFAGVRFLPTGGISAEDVPAYLALDQVIAVGGSWLTAPDLVRARNWPAVTRLAREAVAAVADARGTPG